MAFEDVLDFAVFILRFALILFPTVYLLDMIRDRVETKTLVRKVIVLFGISILVSLAFYPFIAELGQYVIYLETGAEVSLIPFGSDLAAYMLVLLFIFLVYLVVFNKTK